MLSRRNRLSRTLSRLRTTHSPRSSCWRNPRATVKFRSALDLVLRLACVARSDEHILEEEFRHVSIRTFDWAFRILCLMGWAPRCCWPRDHDDDTSELVELLGVNQGQTFFCSWCVAIATA
jgi:hypothetical protein